MQPGYELVRTVIEFTGPERVPQTESIQFLRREHRFYVRAIQKIWSLSTEF